VLDGKKRGEDADVPRILLGPQADAQNLLLQGRERDAGEGGKLGGERASAALQLVLFRERRRRLLFHLPSRVGTGVEDDRHRLGSFGRPPARDALSGRLFRKSPAGGARYGGALRMRKLS
jgi:hypothetical protein